MAAFGSDASHDEKIVALIGEGASKILAAPVSYPPLTRPDLVAKALSEGKTCRIKTLNSRIIVFMENEETRAVVTEMAHSGYRRRYKSFSAQDSDALLKQLQEAYENG
jgi:hypothetical protein